jgi:hypothetical protein
MGLVESESKTVDHKFTTRHVNKNSRLLLHLIKTGLTNIIVVGIE